MPIETLTPPAAAARLGVAPVTFRRWVAAGRVPGVLRTPSGHLRVPAAVVASLLQPAAAWDPSCELAEAA